MSMMGPLDFPALYRSASAASHVTQRRFYLVLGSTLAIFVVSAACSFLDLQSRYLAAAQAGLLFISLGFSIYLASAKPQKSWYGARALAESVKTISWRYMMRTEPFDGADPVARANLITTLRRTIADNREVSAHASSLEGVDQVTPAMEAWRSRTLAERQALYVDQRINHQLGWYSRKALASRASARRWFAMLIFANCLAILAALGNTAYPEFTYWPTDVFAAAAAAVLGWLQGKKYEDLAAAYTLTAHEIGLVRAELATVVDEAAFSKFVADAESAFSREHTQWQARRDTE
jgi:prepilin signal peptidase PulO-like enzyme (type II secretory pathway)